MMKKILILCLMTLIAGCASISKEDCHELQWSERGYKNGLLGIKESTGFADFAASCSEFGISPNKKLYTEGYKKGHTSKCNNARTNAPYDKSCNRINENYASEYTLDKVRQLQNQVQYLESENQRIRNQNLELQTRINASYGTCGHIH